MPEWTKEQLEAITASGSNILVAAAAGSGKTAVLVERIIRKICNKDNPVPVDRLLVLTFTEAAAAEMKRKIADAILSRLRSEPENKWLKEQSILIHSAHISTVHAFCKSVLQNNIHSTSLPAEFTLIDDVENEVLRNSALDKVLERYYSRIDKKQGFRDLVSGYGGIKSDDSLRSTVLKLHNFTRSLAYPKQWLKAAADNYRLVSQKGCLEGTIWEELLTDSCRSLAKDVLDGYRAIWCVVEKEVSADHPFYPYFKELPERFAEAYAPMLDENTTIKDAIGCIGTFKKGQARGKKDLDEELVGRIDVMREELVNKPLKKIEQLLSGADTERIWHIIRCNPRIRVLKQLVRQTEALHNSMKREKEALDFSDLEHETIKLLSNGKGEPTSIAKKLRDRFEEILVDEYQDTNNIQDTMFRLLSKDEKNIFMVGDLKQSIYRFRNANPGIFAEKYENYSNGNGGICIRLFKNFRSRKQVVDSVNGIFDSIMTKSVGGLDYTQEEYLIQGAAYSEDAGNMATEILVTDTNKDNYNPDSDLAEMSDMSMEALTVAERIESLVNNREIKVTDKKTGKLRPVRLGDITVLVRTNSGAAELTRVMDEYDIPYISESGRRYLESIEVKTVLSFLQIIDNPRQDIPLLAVMRSAMFNFSPDELAEIRLCSKGEYYDAVVTAADDGNARAKSFIEKLNRLRDCSVYSGVDELIWRICNELYYSALVGAMPGGAVRQANLKLLYERAAEFEQGALSGLFNFMRYIDRLRESGNDMVAAKPFADTSDTVAVMTIHKSKGLEYPVVIMFGMQKYFNETDERKPVIWNENIGIAMDYVDTIRRVRYSCLPKLLVADCNVRELRSEEMRLFYVALTRAKEKLILSCTSGKTRNKWKDAVYNAEGCVLPGFVRGLSSMRDWLLSAVMIHPDAGDLRVLAERKDIIPDLKKEYELSVKVVNRDYLPETEILNLAEEPITAEKAFGIDNNLKERAEYTYPHMGLTQTPIKLSVSEIKRRQMPEEDYTSTVSKVNNVVLTDSSNMGAAEIGTITHYAMQHMNYKDTLTEDRVNQQLDNMVKSGLISQRQRDVVKGENIFGFFNHPLGVRLREAEHTEREFDFYMEIPANEIVSGLIEDDADESVLLQGIADCFFYEDDGVVLIDFKTDRVSKNTVEDRAKKYKLQMEYYTRGLEKILNCKVKERHLYFLHCGEAVEV